MRERDPARRHAKLAKAFSLCKGDVIVPCDQDDVWEPEKLATLDACFRDDPSVLLAFHDLAIIRSDATPVERTQWQRPASARASKG